MTLHGWELLKLIIAYVLALPIGWERERDERSAGLRTYPLVAIASCAYVVIGIVFLESQEASARIIQGLISGLGLVAGGAIIQDRFRVHGTATAASILGTGAIGTAVAFDAYDIAIALSIMSYLTLRLLKPLKRRAEEGASREARRSSNR